jgi:hypothetical protein
VSSNQQELIQIIRDVFPVDPIPKTLILEEADASGDITQEVIRRFSDRRWTEIGMEDWTNTATVAALVNIMTPSTFRYFLPALLLAVIEDRRYLDRGIEAVLPQNKNRTPRGEWWHEYYSGFSIGQKAAVRRFLELVVGSEPAGTEDSYLAHRALEIGW